MAAWLLSVMNRCMPTILSRVLPLLGEIHGNAVFELDDSGIDGPVSPAAVVRSTNIGDSRTLWIKGWLYRDYDGMRVHKQVIREFFAPLPDLALKVSHFVTRIRRDNCVLVGVHLRRGDYRKWDNGKYFYDDAMFASIMRQVAMVLPHRPMRFLLVSNEPIKLEAFADFDFVEGLGDSIGDLYSLAACDYIVGPPSTYSIWASWYGEVPFCHIEDLTAAVNLGDFRVARG